MIITTAAPEERSAAFALALHHLDAELRPARLSQALALVAAGEIDPAGIFVARAGGNLRGALICVLLPGAGGLFWLPKTQPADDSLENRLVQHGLAWLRRQGAKLAQAVLAPLDVPAAGAFLRSGFRAVTRIQYHNHFLDDLPAPAPQSIRLVTYSTATEPLFHETLLRTYEGTLDCPELSGIRTIDEIIAGHRAQGSFKPERWWLAFLADRPVAVALCTEVPDLEAWDLSYLGVVPQARRRGVARQLAEHVLHEAQRHGAPKMILAVDERNQPALQLYARLGFLCTEYREVYLYFWDRSLAGNCSGPAFGSSL